MKPFKMAGFGGFWDENNLVYQTAILNEIFLLFQAK